MREKKEIKVAIIDLNNGQKNQGIESLRNIVTSFGESINQPISIAVFELRNNGEIPNLDFDLYISTGGPGSPFEGKGKKWEEDFFELLDALDNFNENNQSKKFSLLICHSFQLACIKYKIGRISKRSSTAFGVFPIDLTERGLLDPVFKGLNQTIYSVDSRNWQVEQGTGKTTPFKSYQVLALESDMLNVGYAKCLMAIRFSEEMIGMQFHPEALPDGIRLYLSKPELKKLIIENHGTESYQTMLDDLDDKDKLLLSGTTIIPNFLKLSIHQVLNPQE